jgi:hypothetical protein
MPLTTHQESAKECQNHPNGYANHNPAGSHFIPGVTDLQTALIRMDSGALTRITVSFTNSRWPSHRYTLFGTRASFDSGWVGRDQPRFWTTDIPHLQSPYHLPLGTDVPGAPGICARESAANGSRPVTIPQYHLRRP